jgi:hypothetical protein
VPAERAERRLNPREPTLPGEGRTKRRIDARTASIVAAVIVVASGAAGVFLHQKKEIVATDAADGPTATATETETETASPLPASMRVSLTALCSFESVVVKGDCPAEAGSSVPVNGHRFEYQEDTDGSNHPPGRWNDWIGFKNSDCTHVHLLFALDDQQTRRGDIAHVRVVRPSGTTSSRAGRGAVGVLDADLDGHRRPFTLSSSATDSSDVFMRGYVICPRPR